LDFLVISGFVLLGLLGLGIVALPGIIGLAKNHQYKWLILVLSITSPIFFGLTWLIAMIWVIFPASKTIIDPILASSDGTRNVGDSFTSVKNNFQNGASAKPRLDSRLAEIERLFAQKMISDKERSILREKALSELQ
jgi:hypothetical protein